ncbi:MAG: YitT family protein [Eubacterium sp.]|nr:YitT family protein [Eubacterium sp.]
MAKKGWKDYIKTTLFIIVGNALLAFLVAAFIIPHDIIMGGTTGIAIVLNRIIPVETATLVLIQNIGLLILGLAVLGKKFFFTTVASSVLYPVFLGIMQKIPNIDKITDDTLLASLFAGVLMGISLGLVMRVGSSTGGMDVVNLVLHKWLHIPIAILVWATDIIVVGGQALFVKPEKTLFGIVVLVLEAYALDQVMIFGKSQTQLYVISRNYEEIRKALISDLNLGVTMSNIETGLLENEQKAVLCVIPSRKLFDTTEKIQSIDPEAFITITKIKEVRGRGFTKAREYLNEEINN